MRWWLVYAGTRVTLVRARSATEAKGIADPLFDRGRARRSLPHGRREMIARRATRADVERYWAAEAQMRQGVA